MQNSVKVYYYNTGSGNNAPGESYYCGSFPAGINPYDNTHLDLYYASVKQSDTVDTVRLTITAGKHKEVSDILVNTFLYNTADPLPNDVEPITTIYDGDRPYSIHPDIIGVSIIYGECCAGSGGGREITVEDEGVSKTTNVASFDFVGTGVTVTNSGDDVTVTIPETQIEPSFVTSSSIKTAWDVRDTYLFPINDDRYSYSGLTQNDGVISLSDGFALLNTSGFQRVVETDLTKLTWYNICASSSTSSQITGMGTGGEIKIFLAKYTPQDNDTSITFQLTTLGTLTFNVTANQIIKNSATNTITAMSLGDHWGIVYGYEVTDGEASGTITNMYLQTTAKLWV